MPREAFVNPLIQYLLKRMTSLENKQLFGYSLGKREKIAPSGKALPLQNSTSATTQVKVVVKKVIDNHRDVLIALRDR
jgi:hypothetical protein